MTEALRYQRLASLVFGQPLACTLEAAETVGAFLRSRMEGADFTANRFVGADQVDVQSGRWKGYRRVGDVAVVSVLGELVNRGAWMGASSGLTSFEGIVEQVRQAAADPEVQSILLDINSPGGEAYGMVDAARQMRKAAAGKRIVALANSMAASAAYALASVADEIVVNEGGIVGSIGVVSVHVDRSEQLSKAGVKATVITTGPKKAIGSSLIPLDEQSLAVLQARAARIMDGFVALVTEHRSGLTADAVRAIEGDVLLGEDAVAANLADRTGTFESVLQDLTRGAGRNSSKKGKSMTEPNGAPAAENNAGITQSQLDAAVATAVAQTQQAAAAALEAERGRVAALDQLAAKCGGNQKGLEMIAAAKASGDSAEKTAMALITADVFAQAAVLGALQTDDASAAGAKPAGAPASEAKPGSAATREGLIAEYNASEALQRQYLTAESYASSVLFDRKKKGN